jgi:hypothetical protein
VSISFVIPGRRALSAEAQSAKAEAASPESITTNREYGFSDAQLRIIARAYGASRNDERIDLDTFTRDEG